MNDVVDDAPEVVQPPAEREPEEQPQGPLELQLAIHELRLSAVNIKVGTHPDTGDKLLVIGPVVLNIAVPLTVENARIVARELGGGVIPVSGLSPADRAAAEQLIVRR